MQIGFDVGATKIESVILDVQMETEISLFIDLNNISLFDSVTNKRL